MADCALPCRFCGKAIPQGEQVVLWALPNVSFAHPACVPTDDYDEIDPMEQDRAP